MSLRLWRPCQRGYPDPYHCPDCTPPTNERCPEVAYNGHECRVWGEHRTIRDGAVIHQDGRGMSWFLDTDPDEEIA